jgi:hypothetical protein
MVFSPVLKKWAATALQDNVERGGITHRPKAISKNSPAITVCSFAATVC